MFPASPPVSKVIISPFYGQSPKLGASVPGQIVINYCGLIGLFIIQYGDYEASSRLYSSAFRDIKRILRFNNLFFMSSLDGSC